MRLFACLAILGLAAPAHAEAPAAPATAPAPAVQYSVEDTLIGDLLDDPKAKALLEKHVPGMTTNPQIEMARGFTLRQIQNYAADQLTDEVLKKLDADLKALAQQ